MQVHQIEGKQHQMQKIIAKMQFLRRVFLDEENSLPIPTRRSEKRNGDDKEITAKEFHCWSSFPPGLFGFLMLLLYILSTSMHSYVSMLHLKRSEITVFHIFVQSVVALVILWAYNYRFKRRKFFSLLNQFKRLKAFPAVCYYFVFIAIDGSSSNGFFNTSGGKEVHQLGVAVSPLCVVMVTMWYYRNTPLTKAMLVVSVCSILMMVVFCSEDDPYIPYRFSLTSGAVGILHAIFFVLFVLNAKASLQTQEVSLTQLVHSMNLGCVVFLPLVLFANGELGLLFSGLLPGKRNTVASFYGMCVMASLQLVCQIASLQLINSTSPLFFIATRGLAWIPVTLIITFSFKLELLVSSFLAFFISGLIFLATLVEEVSFPKT